MANDLTMKECSNFFDGLPNDKRDGMNKTQFMGEVRRMLDPKSNAKVLDRMIESRSRQRVAKAQKASIDRAMRNSAAGLR